MIVFVLLPGCVVAEPGNYLPPKEGTDVLRGDAQETVMLAPSATDESVSKVEQDEDVLEQALSLIGEADGKWKEGKIEEALAMLDQAYSLMLDTNGDPKVARQKDDVRLLISKKILTIYSTAQGKTKGKRSEIPLVMNDNVEREIRSFLGPEREFFLASYQRSLLYRKMIKEELKRLVSLKNCHGYRWWKVVLRSRLFHPLVPWASGSSFRRRDTSTVSIGMIGSMSDLIPVNPRRPLLLISKSFTVCSGIGLRSWRLIIAGRVGWYG